MEEKQISLKQKQFVQLNMKKCSTGTKCSVGTKNIGISKKEGKNRKMGWWRPQTHSGPHRPTGAPRGRCATGQHALATPEHWRKIGALPISLSM